MTIGRRPWPYDTADQITLVCMIRAAVRWDRDWVPPERFAYTIDADYDLLDFVNPLGKLKYHVNELWEAMPLEARYAYYLEEIWAGLDYATTGLLGLNSHAKAPAELLKAFDTALADLYRVREKLVVDLMLPKENDEQEESGLRSQPETNP